MKPMYSIPFLLALVIGSGACSPPPPVDIPTLVALPPLTLTPSLTLTVPVTLTPTALPPTLTLTETPSLTLTATATDTLTLTPSLTPRPVTLLPSVTLTPSETITETIAPTLTPTPTASPDVGAFSALVGLAGRVTVLPIETRFSPPTQTALAIARNQIASQTPPGVLPVISAGSAGLVLATLPPGVSLPPLPPGPPAPGGEVSPGGAPSVVIVATAVSGSGPLPPLPLTICQFPAPGNLGTLLAADPALNNTLGCPVGQPPTIASVGAASQIFERGVMVYTASPTGGIGSIYALTGDGRYRRFDDPYVAGMPDSSGEPVPPGLLEPIRGFGAVWRQAADVRSALGYALAGEQGDTASLVGFSRGTAISVPQRGVTYVLIEDAPGTNAGTWRTLSGGF